MLFTLKSAETATRLQQVREAAGNDMLKNMQLVFPACAKIQMEVVERHGFKGDGEGNRITICSYFKNLIFFVDSTGLLQFMKQVKELESKDAEVLQLSKELTSIVIPAVRLPVASSRP